MFTECPECSTGFRVTAKVLQQAGGRVRCGGCGHAFSALEHLTEELPSSSDQDDTLPSESAADDLTSDEKFRETSRQLLKTLHELAGPEDVHIEDTGFEWQVLDDEDEEGIATDAAPAEDDEESSELEEITQVPADEEHYDDSTELADDTDDDEGIATATDITGIEEEAAPKEEEWTDLLEDVTEDGTAADDIPLEVEEELAAIHHELSAKDDAAPVDLDSQFELQAEAMGLEISGAHDLAKEKDKDIAADAVEEEEIAAGRSRPSMGSATYVHPVQNGAPAEEAIELSIADYDPEAQPEPEHAPDDEVPEPSEEEMTINQQIDQDLLAAAAQDQDLRATIIGLETKSPDKLFDEDSPDVETIIMEGDVVRGAIEKEREKAKQERALKRFDNAGNLIDSYVANRLIRGGRRSGDPLGYGMMSGAILLVLLLAGQFIHANRQSLSTSELFNSTIGPVYRLLGNPVTPEWSIKGWQFEATNGSVADDQDVLTIYSRIGNRSKQPLPYPLVHVSLTDRWEEIIGSRVLEPNEYLAGDINPGKPVIPGENFTAVITIEEPSVDATGFKLNVCYRASPGRVRCATEDFKD